MSRMLFPVEPNPDPNIAARDKNAGAVRRRTVIRAIEDHLGKDRDERAERIKREFAEAFDRPELEEDLAYKSPARVVAAVRQDLGIGDSSWSPEPPRRTMAAVEQLQARARKGGSKPE